MGHEANTVWMAVTKDRYELPVAVADTERELAGLMGVHPDTIRGVLQRARKSGRRCKYVKVQLQEDEECEST